MTMANRVRLVVAQILAAITLIMALIYTAGFYDSSLSAGNIGRSSALIAIVLSIVAFAVSVKLRSGLIAGLLIASGIIMMIPPTVALVAAGAIVVPGPIYGIIFYAIILALGIV